MVEGRDRESISRIRGTKRDQPAESIATIFRDRHGQPRFCAPVRWDANSWPRSLPGETATRIHLSGEASVKRSSRTFEEAPRFKSTQGMKQSLTLIRNFALTKVRQ